MFNRTDYRSLCMAAGMVLAATPVLSQEANIHDAREGDVWPSELEGALYSIDLPPIPEGPIKRFRIPISHAQVEIAPGIYYEGWTLGGSVPGPAIHVEEGDRVEIVVVNESDMTHSIDFHSGRMAPSEWYRDMEPGDSITFDFVANDPGAFMVHCGTTPVLAHIANGMYLPMVVRPRGLPVAEREFVITQSEFYTEEGSYEALTFDANGALNEAPDYMAFNGQARQYAADPVSVRADTPYRAWVMNAGPNRTSAFHIVGTIFDRVVDGDPKGALYNVQTWNVPPGGGAMFEFSFAEEGTYPFVTHAFGDATKGAMGLFEVYPDDVFTLQSDDEE